MKEQILKILRARRGDYVSGQSLCEGLNVSRTAIWKAVKALREEGYVIEAVSNKGYLLKELPDVITDSEILSQLYTKEMGKHIYFYEQIESTNNVARLLAEQGAVHGSLVITGVQTGGKGRLGRSWISPKDEGISMTLILKPQLAPVNASMLTLVAALAVSDAIKLAGLSCAIKWPNDIVIGNKKVCGILTEMSADMDRINYVVIGVGINVNTENILAELKDTATSMLIEGGVPYNRALIVKNVMEAFENYYHIFMKTEDLSGIVDVYNQRLINRDCLVKVKEKGGDFTGLSKGVNTKGELIVISDGVERAIGSGEVSVRGISGYI